MQSQLLQEYTSMECHSVEEKVSPLFLFTSPKKQTPKCIYDLVRNPFVHGKFCETCIMKIQTVHATFRICILVAS